MSNIDWGTITKKLKVRPKSLNHKVGSRELLQGLKQGHDNQGLPWQFS